MYSNKNKHCNREIFYLNSVYFNNPIHFRKLYFDVDVAEKNVV